MNSPTSILVVTHNGMPYLPALRAALTPQLRHDDELLILDNASTDGTADWIEREWPTARLIRSDVNHFFAKGNNLLTREASRDVVFYLNQDTIPDPGTLDLVRQLTGPDQAVTYAQRFPWVDHPVIPVLDWSGVYLWKTPSTEIERVNALSGGAFSLHRETLDRLGGLPFDMRLVHYAEDTYLSLRLQELGQRMVAASTATVTHFSSPSTGSARRDFRRAIGISKSRFRAHTYALGWPATLARLPRLLAAGLRKADVDSKRNLTRALGLEVATILGYAAALGRNTRRL